MIKKIKWLINVFLFVISIFYKYNNFFVKCFNNEGHEAIGMVAMSGLKSDQLYELKKLLNGKDLVDIGKWGHLVHGKIKEAEPMHFNLHDNFCKKVEFTCEDKNGLCLINSIKHFYNKLLLKPNSKPENEINFKYPRNIDFENSDLLKYLVSLLIDMHQPLRISFLNDNAGKDIKITYLDNNLKKVNSNLFEYLENELLNKMVEKYQSSWYSGWTHINQILNEHTKDQELFDKHGIDVIDIWANDIMNGICLHFYLNDAISSFLENDNSKMRFNTSKVLDINYVIEFHLERLIKNNILRAGSRISIILNHIFVKKKFPNLRKKSAFDKVEYQKARIIYTNSIYKGNALYINLLIILIVVVAIVYFNFIRNKRNKVLLPNKSTEAELQEKCN